MNLKKGYIIYSYTEEPDELEFGFVNYTWLQKIFTRYSRRFYNPKGSDGKKSHVEVAYNDTQVIDVSHKTKLRRFSIPKKPNLVWIYKVNLPQELLNEVVDELWELIKYKPYGYLQIIYFARRWFWENYKYAYKLHWKIIKALLFPLHLYLLFKPDDIRKWNNWFVTNFICSEAAGWKYKDLLYRKGIKYNLSKQRLLQLEILQRRISEWNSNNYHTSDDYLTTNNSSLFELVYTNVEPGSNQNE